jgi:NADPH-dependent curcumin reductase CurA
MPTIEIKVEKVVNDNGKKLYMVISINTTGENKYVYKIEGKITLPAMMIPTSLADRKTGWIILMEYNYYCEEYFQKQIQYIKEGKIEICEEETHTVWKGVETFEI